MVLLNAYDGYDVLAMAFAAPLVGVEMQIGADTLGWLMSAGLIGMMAGSLFLSPLGDTLGRKTVGRARSLVARDHHMLDGLRRSLAELAPAGAAQRAHGTLTNCSPGREDFTGVCRRSFRLATSGPRDAAFGRTAMKVVRAEEMGMCFGVRDALRATQSVADPTLVTIHGELVHNPRVVRQLDDAGFRQSSEDSRQAAVETPLVLITAHGVSNAERQRLAAADKVLIDTTCPLVRRVHDAAQELQAEGRHVLIVGKPGHVEVRGIIEDLEGCHVIEKPDNVVAYDSRLLGIVSQTTTPPDVFADVCANVRRLNPLADVRILDTVCRPTKVRQRAVLDLARRVDAVVVVGGRNSNNTRWLVQVCREQGTPAVHVENAGDLDASWFANVQTVGLTAGTSTLDETIDAVHRVLENIRSNS
jgi:4-hydroxy-3-methylbut-2-en-1-yl diphosphate reductase